MEQQPTKEIALTENVTSVIVRTNEEIKSLQEQIKPVQEQIQAKTDGIRNLVMGICLQEGINFEQQSINVNADFSKLLVYDVEKNETLPEYPIKKGKVKKMN